MSEEHGFSIEHIVACVGITEIIVSVVGFYRHSPHEKRKGSQGKSRYPYQPNFWLIASASAFLCGIFLLGLDRVKPEVFSVIVTHRNSILKGLFMTLRVSLVSVLLGTIIGVAAAVVLSLHKTNIWLSIFDSLILGTTYILLGIPALVLLFLCYYGLPYVGIHVPVFWASVLALGINLSPFVTKIIAASIHNIPKDEIDSAISFGYSPYQLIRDFKLPFVIKNARHSLLVEYYTTIKLSSLAGLYTLREFYKATVDISADNLETVGSYIIMAMGYVLIVSSIAVLVDFLDRKRNP